MSRGAGLLHLIYKLNSSKVYMYVQKKTQYIQSSVLPMVLGIRWSGDIPSSDKGDYYTEQDKDVCFCHSCLTLYWRLKQSNQTRKFLKGIHWKKKKSIYSVLVDFTVIYNSPSLSLEDTFQDPQWVPEMLIIPNHIDCISFLLQILETSAYDFFLSLLS